MFDMHYDLLTMLYVLKDNKKYIEKVIDDINNNLVGVCANMYFMSRSEMEEELNIKDDIDVSKMFKEAINIFNNLDIRSKTIFSIEGCDYVKDIKELEYLNGLGLKAILPVWNNENKYGSGNRSNKGLTKEGKELIEKAIDLNMGIDLSHANEKTFFDIIDVIKNHPKKCVCYVSHSNIYNLYDHPRNLKDKQLQTLKKVDGYIGIVSYPLFLTNEKNIKKAYLNHIKYAVDIMGIDRVMISSDSMEFYSLLDNDYVKSPFDYKNIKEEIYNLLKEEFSSEEIDKIMFKNALKIYEMLHI